MLALFLIAKGGDTVFKLFRGLFASRFNASFSVRLPLVRFLGANEAVPIGVQHAEVFFAGQELARRYVTIVIAIQLREPQQSAGGGRARRLAGERYELTLADCHGQPSGNFGLRQRAVRIPRWTIGLRPPRR